MLLHIFYNLLTFLAILTAFYFFVEYLINRSKK